MSTQPTPDVTREDVVRIARREFPEEWKHVIDLLDAYGTEPYERERERVQIAILKLVGSRKDRLSVEVAAAKRDYRDSIAAAEYPLYMRKVRPGSAASLEIIASDWSQYYDWFGK